MFGDESLLAAYRPWGAHSPESDGAAWAAWAARFGAWERFGGVIINGPAVTANERPEGAGIGPTHERG